MERIAGRIPLEPYLVKFALGYCNETESVLAARKGKIQNRIFIDLCRKNKMLLGKVLKTNNIPTGLYYRVPESRFMEKSFLAPKSERYIQKWIKYLFYNQMVAFVEAQRLIWKKKKAQDHVQDFLNQFDITESELNRMHTLRVYRCRRKKQNIKGFNRRKC